MTIHYLPTVLRLAQHLRSRNAASVAGCSEQEIQQLELRLGQALPKVYQEFLFIMGNRKGDFLASDYMERDSLDYLCERADAIMSRNQRPMLPATCFVFQLHEDYSFYYFLLSDTDNPAVYLYMESDLPFEVKKLENRLAEFLENNARTHARLERIAL